MSTYYSHVSDSSYGNPGFYVAPPTGTVKDQGGRVVNLRPDENERYARRIMIHTNLLPPPSRDGVYTAKIRPAKGTVAVRLVHSSIPRPMSRVRAQLVLYSVPIKNNSNEPRDVVLQRLSRNLLLSNDTSDFPFFTPGQRNELSGDYQNGLVFDWRARKDGLWLQAAERTTSIPPQFATPYANQLLDIDTLSVMVPEGCTLNELGSAFRQALDYHTGTEDDRNNSLWKRFGISVTDSGFSVYENANVADQFITFAAIETADEAAALDGNDAFEQVARDSYRPMMTPIEIFMDISRSAYVDQRTFLNSSFAPSEPAGSQAIRDEFKPLHQPATDRYKIEIGASGSTLANRGIYSLCFPHDVSSANILEVKSKRVVELHVLGQTRDSTTNQLVPNSLDVTYLFGTHETFTGETTQVHFPDAANQAQQTVGVTSSTATTIQLADITGIVDTSDPTVDPPVIVPVLLMSSTSASADTVHNISQVKRSYQKSRDIRMGLRWPGRQPADDFVIESNYEHDSSLLQPNELADAGITYSTKTGAPRQVRTDVATLSQYTLSVSNITTPDIPSATLSVSNFEQLQEFDNLRTTTELPGTYIPANTSGATLQLHPMRKDNDAHQADEMMFCGHMMTVTEPIAMTSTATPVSSHDVYQQDRTKITTALRPQGNTSDDANAFGAVGDSEFYREGLGWSTSITHNASRFVMPAHPVRFTQLDFSTLNADGNQSIYKRKQAANSVADFCSTSINPLVARLLHKGDNDSVPFYELVHQSDTGYNAIDVDADSLAQMALIGKTFKNPLQNDYGILSFYRPRTFSNGTNNALVVSIGGENYTILSARFVSTLTNNTKHTLDLCCDRHHLRPPSTDTTISPQSDTTSGVVHFFYDYNPNVSTTPKFAAKTNAKYFSWVFELDRPVAIHSGLERTTTGTSTRVFSGIDDDACMFCPSNFHKESGRNALSKIQDAPHTFHVRAGSSVAEESQPLMLLHGLGDVERPINSTSTTTGDIFAVVGLNNDQKNALGTAGDATTYMRSPKTVSELAFSFVNPSTGKPMDIKGNALLLFDVFCQNE